MGAWSVEPFGNDVAADWAWELEDESDWSVIADALADALDDDGLDHETATIAVAAAEVVAHGLDRATQQDAYTEEVTAFVRRAGRPDDDLIALAVAALRAATCEESVLAAEWAEAGDGGWNESIDELRAALTA